MSYAYDQRKRPRGPQDPAPARTGAPEQGPTSSGPRPWEITEAQLQTNHFNPTGSKTLGIMQASIEQAKDPIAAYEMFANIVESAGSSLITKSGRAWNQTEVDPDKFKAKLKNMLRIRMRMMTAGSARRRRSTTETTSWAMCSIL